MWCKLFFRVSIMKYPMTKLTIKKYQSEWELEEKIDI